MCGKKFIKFGHTDCKISAFKVEKQVFQHIVTLDYFILDPLSLKLFTLQSFEL